jgi:hypothetical protein
VSKPDKSDFHIDLTFTGQKSDYAQYARPIGIVVAAVGIIFILATMTTGIAARILPMSDEYLQAMVPALPDRSEPLGLTSLMHDITDKTITVSGSIMNRADRPLSNLLVVVEMQDTTARFPQTVVVPVMPAEIQPKATGTFMAMATLQEKPAGYTLKFRFADGPFIPHKDDRGPAITITPQPTQPIRIPQTVK